LKSGAKPVAKRNDAAAAQSRHVESRARKPARASVRLADVARQAGVSTATVSRAINDPELVSPDLRERVRRAAQSLDWVPNGAAKALASTQSRTVGAVIPSLENPNFAKLIESLQQELSKANYTLLLGCAESKAPEVRNRIGRNMVERGVDCLVLVGEAQPPELLELLQAHAVPYVITFTTGSGSGGQPCIGFDNYLASARITRHLLDLGHRRFGMVTESPEWNDRIAHRIAGVRETLAKAGLTIQPKHFAEVDSARRVASGRSGLKYLLSDPDDQPTAIICSNDYLAIGVMIEAASQHLRVPDDISVTGFDDIDLAGHFEPALTTIRVPAGQIGEEIARYVVRFLKQGTAPLPPPLSADCVVRNSTAAPPQLRRAHPAP